MEDMFVMRCGGRERIVNRENSQGGFPSIHYAHRNIHLFFHPRQTRCMQKAKQHS